MNSKRKGNVFETQVACRLREVFPDCRTSRFMGALWLDSCKVDLTGTPGYQFQAKATERSPAYHSILSEMPQNHNINVVLHKRNNSGTVAVLKFDDFLSIIKKLQRNGTI